MPTYPNFDGRTPLTKEVANALVSQSQAGSRRAAGRQINLTHGVGGAAYQSAVGRTTYGIWAKLTQGTQDGGITYYDWVEQARGVYGLWTEHPTPLKGSFANSPAVEKTNRPGVLGEVVFLRRIPGDLSREGLAQLWVFDSTFPGLWGVANSSAGAWFTSFTPGVWDWSGPTSIPIIESGYPGFTANRWLTPKHPDGETQQWIYEAVPGGNHGTHRVLTDINCYINSGAFSLRTTFSPTAGVFPPNGPAFSFDDHSFTLDASDPGVGPVAVVGVQIAIGNPGFDNRPDSAGPGPSLPPYDFIATLSIITSYGDGPGSVSSRYFPGFNTGQWFHRTFFPFDWFFVPSGYGLSTRCLVVLGDPPGRSPLNVTVSVTTTACNPTSFFLTSGAPAVTGGSGKMWLEYTYTE